MVNNKLSTLDLLKIFGCLIFDIALILAYFNIFSLFILLAPVKSLLILFILLLGLLAVNVAVVFPSMIFRSIGVPYSTSIVILFVFYAIAANIFSIFLIAGSTVWLIVWQLIIFAFFIVVLSIIAMFLKGAVQNIGSSKKEQAEKTSIMIQLMEIEDILAAKENQEAILQCLNSFKALKERIKASTPFGRITGNSAVLEVENKIKDNLISLKIGFQGNLTDKDLLELQRLLEETRSLVMSREILNVK